MLTDLHGQKRPKMAQTELNRLLMAYERYVTGRGGARTHFKMADLSGLNLANRILNEIDFSGASLVGASLHGSSLLRASLYCADLRDCDLRNAKMIGADMRGASFKGARLAFAVLDNADLRAAAMMHVQPEGVSISGRSVWDHGEHDTAQSRRHGVDFSNCSLKHVSFENAKLDDVNFTGALLNGANFKGAQLTNVTMRGAVLTGVHLEEFNLPPEAFAECVIDVTPDSIIRAPALRDKLQDHQLWISSDGKQGAAANFDGEDLRPLKKDFAGRELAGLSARNAVAIGVDFSGCRLQGAKFDGADLRDANFSRADLCGASFHAAKLAHGQFAKAHLGNLHLVSGEILPPNLSGAEAVPQQFQDAILDDKLAGFGLGD
jgi:uncharacterized protein YjbI with pentapeptide repeats